MSIGEQLKQAGWEVVIDGKIHMPDFAIEQREDEHKDDNQDHPHTRDSQVNPRGCGWLDKPGELYLISS